MEVLKSYLNNKIDTLYKNTNQIPDNHNLFKNKLFEKKIEYMNNYLHNSITEIEEINQLIEDNLFDDSTYTIKKLQDYESMENSINNYVVHNL